MTDTKNALNEELRATSEREAKYLTFALAEEEYGIGILKVKEIIGMMPITSVPQTPQFVKGVINLRGKVIPVVDLRLKFGISEIEYTERTCIIVVEIAGENGDTQMGIVVDAVSEVLNIKASDVEETPTFGAALNTSFIMGMAKVEGNVKILLDIDKVLSKEEFETVDGTGQRTAPAPFDAAGDNASMPPEQAIQSESAEAGVQ